MSEIDDLLNSSASDLSLETSNPKYWEIEYSEVNKNMRHANEVRSGAIRYWIMVDALLLAAMGIIVSDLQVNEKFWQLMLSAIGGFGVFFTITAHTIERRSYKYYILLAQRGRILEYCVKLNGQGWFTFDRLKKSNNDSLYTRGFTAHRILTFLFLVGCIFWMLFPICIYFAIEKQ